MLNKTHDKISNNFIIYVFAYLCIFILFTLNEIIAILLLFTLSYSQKLQSYLISLKSLFTIYNNYSFYSNYFIGNSSIKQLMPIFKRE